MPVYDAVDGDSFTERARIFLRQRHSLGLGFGIGLSAAKFAGPLASLAKPSDKPRLFILGKKSGLRFPKRCLLKAMQRPGESRTFVLRCGLCWVPLGARITSGHF
jgi:hypothetical protein